ncbi:hypothetical protein SAMN04489743_1396 [Pseudarthrobacter equi]|uniref:RelA/SpoT domain-containing protein n=1 Tax=Pseudarthrobacter equi TaxID=728066 RepID=A0A1H1WQM2_9MICC|nr:hypothetical protein [Pseudarthrobacter equi]SDS98931.1 hypothetical protein SAMN04489743_1396 [Pseudarthrobacter equi]
MGTKTSNDYGRDQNALSFYDDNLWRYKRLMEEALFALEAGIGFKVHSVTSRVKERQSVSDKILRKAYRAPEDELEDIVGLRMVCLYTSDLQKADSVIRNAFDVVSFEDKINDTSEDSFGYMSVHYICQLREENKGPRYDSLQGLKFEVQCRTILMDAWANVSHHLAYKGKNSLPENKKRAFHALAGLFYVADEQFQQLLHTTTDTRPSQQGGHLDRDSVKELLEELYPNREREESDEMHLLSISDFVEEAIAAGYTSLGTLREDLTRFYSQGLEHERAHPPLGEPGEKFFGVGIARATLNIANPTFRANWARGRQAWEEEEEE